jgi:hypothetical protein
VTNLGDCDGTPANGCETDLLNDVHNCNGCGLACLGPLNSTPLCSGGTCTWYCNAGFVPLGGACALFGGAWELDDCGRCVDPNPYSTVCSCPPGFAQVTMRIVNDCPAAGYSWATVAFCTAPTYPGGSDWAGVYQRNDPSAGGACVVPNPYTAGCNCPAGTAAISLRAEVAGFNGTTIGLCCNTAAPITTFGGAYEVGDVGSVCLVGNPRAAGCTCPAGTAPFPLRGIFYHGTPPGDWGTQMWICKP